MITKQFLIKEYIKKRKSSAQIARQIGCSRSTIWKYLKKYNIKVRNSSESHKGIQLGKNNPMFGVHLLGKDNGNYIDGRSSKIYYCINCGVKIHLWTGLYGQGRCRSCSKLFLWKTKEYREKTLKAMFKSRDLSPNKPEKLLSKLLPKTYKFVGDGQLIVGGFNPDFVNKDRTKIIELYGCYWHKCPNCNFGNTRKIDIQRIKTYKRLGYKVLIIWEHELKDLDKIKNKVLDFNY